jgi:hypothetical protein
VYCIYVLHNLCAVYNVHRIRADTSYRGVLTCVCVCVCGGGANFDRCRPLNSLDGLRPTLAAAPQKNAALRVGTVFYGKTK